MHIQERTNTILTTCTKMTEEVDIRHGVNGNSSGKAANEDVPSHGSANSSSGGRLKFFKDGKFILELVRGSTREGERPGWVSVPRKTFWPPAAAPATPPSTTAHLPRGERATSLSVSDDNSSIQSSPWQRDHCWKQSNPRKNISKELTLYYCRPSSLLNSVVNPGSKFKRRRPYDTSYVLDSLTNGSKKNLTNGICFENKRNGNVDHSDNKCFRGEDCVDGVNAQTENSAANSTKYNSEDADRWLDYDRERYYHMKLKKPYQYHKLRVYKKTKPSLLRKELNKTVEKLRDKIASLPMPVNAKLASCRQEHMMVSPRKRILRELERVSLEDQGTKRRAKTVPTLSTVSYPPSPGPSHAAHKPPPDTPPSRSYNGTTSNRRETPVTKNVSSYSIHSLLSMPDESPSRRSPDAKRSPLSFTPTSVKTESPSSVNSPDLSPSPDNYRYRYALTLGSPGQAGPAHRDSPTPPSELTTRYRSAYVPQSTPPYATQARASRTSPHCYGSLSASTQYRGSPARESPSAPPEWRDVPYLYPPYAAPYLPPHLYRASPSPLWMHYAMSPGIPPGPWAPMPHPLLTDHIPKEEPTSDLPLNLSKH